MVTYPRSKYYLEIHGLIKENIFFPIVKAKIPLGKESIDEVEEFIHALLTLRVSILFNRVK